MKCKSAQKRMHDYVDGLLASGERKAIDVHLQNCEQCAANISLLQSILVEAGKMEKQTAPDSLWLTIEKELDAEAATFWSALKERLSELYRATKLGFPGPAYKASFGLALVLIGVLIGRFVMPSQHQDLPLSLLNSKQPRLQLAARTNTYFEKSKILFLGVVNADEADLHRTDFSPEKKWANALVEEAAFLKENLSDRKNARTKQLVGELELILLELANMETSANLDNVELIRSGIEQKGLLLKINLHDME